MQLYYLEDYSLGEISETFNVSRQAVYDNIRRTEKMLEAYEDKLQLYKKFKERQRILTDLTTALSGKEYREVEQCVFELKELD